MAVKVLSKGEATRERICAAAERIVLEKGFAATSLEEIMDAAKVTKSGFFYHFKDKHDLAKALLQRYVDHDTRIMDELFERADALIDDPLHSYLAFLKMFAEVMDDLPDRHPGCMIASYCYQDQIYHREIRQMSAEGVLTWRKRFRERLDAIAKRYPPRAAINLDALADMNITIVEGGIILDKGRAEKGALPRQVLMLRDLIKTLFAPA
ncbi:MAG TPA: TetR/AcrR family transcriptional regulator [Candidatus Binatia bacterium]|nr:TetR/AcrR family transcriptional regulator [Candidatus Binatia bacterium]